MSQDRLPPPEGEACLVRLRSSSQKGGTIIAEDVVDRATHERRVCDPDGYRPEVCLKCGGDTLHVHDYRERVLLAEPDTPVARVVRYRCVGCEARWQVLPRFIARHLWRTWTVVEHALTEAAPPEAPSPGRWTPVPERTERRWRARWLRPAGLLVGILAACGDAAWAAIAATLKPEASCADLVAEVMLTAPVAAGLQLATVAALIYRMQPKVRLM